MWRIAEDWPSIALALALALWLWLGLSSTRIEFQCQIALHMIQCQAKVAVRPVRLSVCPYIVSSDLQPASLVFFLLLVFLVSLVFCLFCVFSFLGIAAGGDTSVWG